MNMREEYERWLANATADADVAAELKAMDDAKVEDAFYRDLAFGTGGLRGVIGAGTNRMNIYTVAKASQGLADYLKKHYEKPSISIGYDSRIKSDVFAKVAAGVFAANGVQVNIWPTLLPVPTVSFATRYLHTSAGVMVTASHNPSKYNGYKVYGADGCQITTEAAAEILAEIEKLDIFADVKNSEFEAGVAAGQIKYIPDEVYTAFVNEVKNQSVLFGEEVNKDVAIVYSPLNGTGLKPVTRTLKEMGYTNITVVKEQEQPDGNFPTCPYPNPEIKEAMALGMEYAKKCNADLLLATDPDCDRVGIAVKNKSGEYQLLTGNQTGMLLLDYICSQRQKHGKMPADPVMVKTIVTMDMGEQIATHYGLRTINVLTGFKFIGEQIGKLEQQGKADSYVFGFEESYGYLTGSYVRDKDGVDAAYMICEMFSYYATRGISLLDKLEELFKTYGYCMNTLHSYEFDGSAGFAKMQNIMQAFRGDITEFGGKKVVKLLDYAQGLDGLPKSDVLKFLLEDNCSVVVRPSGTEPKLKTYISVSAENEEAAKQMEAKISESAENIKIEKRVEEKKTTLLIMAAGIGSRFGGGIKQLEPVDAQHHIIMDYSIHDAIEAGFNKVVFIIRKDIEHEFKEVIGDRIEAICKAHDVTVDYAFQDINDIPGTLPEGRTKPWGTGQAVLAAKDALDTPFIVINADDYYGKEGFRAVHDYLVNGGQSCMAGFVLKNTLSDNGGVTRGICKMDEQNNLTEVVETKNIVKTAGGAEADGVVIDTDSLVSMNMWGLTPDFLKTLEDGFKEFFEKEVPANPLKAEYLIPTFIGELLAADKMSVKVLRSNDTWYGMTYKEDVEAVKASFKKMLDDGIYKEDLFADL